MNNMVAEETDQRLFSVKRWSVFSSGNYPYVCARVRAKRGLLLSHDVYAKLLMMDVHEITRFLGESRYKKEITELGLHYAGFELIDLALNRNMAEVYHQILGFCGGDLYTMLSAYLQHEDVENIKTVLRGKFYNAKTEEIMRAVRSTGKYPEEYWRNLVLKSTTVEETIENLKGNEYYETLSACKDEWKTHPDSCENQLERVYYTSLLNSIRSRSEPNMLFVDFVRREIDLVNLKALLLMKFENVEPEKIKPMLLEGGDLSEKTMKLLIDASDFKVFLEELQKLSFSKTIHEKISTIEETGSLSHVIRALEKEHLARATTSSYQHPLSILPILDYLIRKRIEVENLRILARGKEKGLSEQVLRELLVI